MTNIRPIKLAANNFTPLTRTPWAGFEIARGFKDQIVKDRNTPIGESWEVSCDPAFPSFCPDMHCTLQELIDKDPEAMLGAIIGRRPGPTCEILVKLLNAATPLSLQIHPDDDDPDLSPNECGKPETWYILKAESEAGIYLGFKEKISHAQLKEALTGEGAKDLLQFVPVKPGDYFEIAPGVPHAIGGGVTLLEPQRILKGKSGKTFRLWDWGRRYNGQGNEDPDGTPRPLHIEQALKLIDTETCYGEEFTANLRRFPTHESLGEVIRKRFPANANYGLDVYSANSTAEVDWPHFESYTLVLPLTCGIEINGQSYSKGQPLFIAANGEDIPFVRPTEPGDWALIYPNL